MKNSQIFAHVRVGERQPVRLRQHRKPVQTVISLSTRTKRKEAANGLEIGTRSGNGAGGNGKGKSSQNGAQKLVAKLESESAKEAIKD